MTRTDYYKDSNAPQANSIVVATTAFIINDSGKLLMIRRTDNDLYAIPGGALELGETISECAIREVEEETGINIETTGVIGIYSDPEHVIAFTDGEVRQEFSICLRAHVVSGELRTSNESKEVLWVEPGKLDELNIHPSIRLRIKHGFDERPQPFYA
jgi:ADP-ribose pyrophosphatase YjhB (NUDIX family)